MAKALYVGVGGKARKMKAAYIGISGKARKIKKIYVGVGGKARLVYQSYIPVTGISLKYEYGEYTRPDKYPWRATFTATLTPSDATNKGITWSVESDSQVFYIAPSGNTCYVAVGIIVDGIMYTRGGRGTLTATAADGKQVTIPIQSISYSDYDGDKTYRLKVG